MLRDHSPGTLAALAAIAPSGPDVADLVGARRARIWDLSAHLHCSIVGTCLTARELRQLFTRIGGPDAGAASDHDLHGRGVSVASRRDEGGKLLNKCLDKRHETAIRRFGKAGSAGELRALWTRALEQGEIAGPYWALLTHPASDSRLVQDVFGDVHMLSHQIGAAARLDIARLRRLEAELAERDDKLARQQDRLAAAAAERVALRETIHRLEVSRTLSEATPARRSPFEGEIASLRSELAETIARAASLTERLDASERRRVQAEAEARAWKEGAGDLRRELTALEAALTPRRDPLDAPLDVEALREVRLLYVGGRPKLIEQIETFVAARGGELLSHDGGVEDSLALLPGLVSQADAVYFPVDCVSHSAAEKVKTLCRRLAKRWAPLRSASLASFARAICEYGDSHRTPIVAERAADFSSESTLNACVISE
jgi:hypothetical protein